MQLADAINLLRQVCAAYKGVLQEHQAIQQALTIVENKCIDVPKEEGEKKDDEKKV